MYPLTHIRNALSIKSEAIKTRVAILKTQTRRCLYGYLTGLSSTIKQFLKGLKAEFKVEVQH